MNMQREVPERCRKAYDRAMSGKSVTAGVKSFCLECVGYDREEVRLCSDPGCPLFPYRPGHDKKGTVRVYKPMTEEQRQVVVDRFKAARLAKKAT
jgi:hypothetical protein